MMNDFPDFNKEFGNFNNDFDKSLKRGMGAFVVVWIISFIAGLAIAGVIIWAIITLVGNV